MQMRLKDGKDRVLTMSYDDGNVQDIRLIGIFDRYGIRGTFNLNSGLFPEKTPERTVFTGKLSWEEAVELYDDPAHEVAAHGLTHPWLSELSSPDIIREITEDRKNLESRFGKIVRGMAFPFGCYNDKTLTALKAAGIVYSRTPKSTHGFDFPDNWLTLPATCHHNDPELMRLAKSFLDDPLRFNRPKLFYVWGHSYEFDNDDNWNVIEEFCEFIGNRDSVWYATNIEIYDYVHAYYSLATSYDGTIVSNPSAIPVWFTQNGETYKIEPGETLRLK